MTRKQWLAVAKKLVPHTPGFELTGQGLVRWDHWLPQVITYDSSAFSKDTYYLHGFVLPLFVPTEYITMSFGSRIGYASWSMAEGLTDELVDAVVGMLPTLAVIGTADGMRALTESWDVDPYHLEVRICLSVLDAEIDELERYAERIPTWVMEWDYHEEIIARCAALVDLVRSRGFSAGLAELESRRDPVAQLLR